MSKCPNTSNPIIRRISNITGVPVMYNAFKKNGGHDLTKAPNGKESKLFNDLFALTDSFDKAVVLKTSLLSDKAQKLLHNDASNKFFRDSNGEPKIFYGYQASDAFNGQMFFSKSARKGYKAIPVVMSSKEVADFTALLKPGVNSMEDVRYLENSKLENNSDVLKIRTIHNQGHDTVIVRTPSNSSKLNILPLFNPGDFDGNTLSMRAKTQMIAGKNGVTGLGSKIGTALAFPASIVADIENSNSDLYSNEPDAEQIEYSMYKNKRLLAGFLIKAIKSTFPDIQIEITNNEDSLDRFGELKHGWVDNGVVYLNSDNLSPETALHELGHIIEPLIAKSNPKVYNNVISSIESEIAQESGMFYELYKKFKKNKGLDTYEKVISEVFAEDLAITTLSQVEDIIAERNIQDANANNWLSKIKAVFANIKKISSEMFSKMFNAKIFNLEDLGMNLAKQLMGNSKFEFTKEEQKYLTDYFQHEGVKFREVEAETKKASIKIESVKDMFSVLMGDAYRKDNSIRKSEFMAAKKIREVEAGKPIVIKFRGKTFKYPNNISFNELTAKINENVMLPMEKMKNNIKNSIVKKFDVNDPDSKELYSLLGPYTTYASIDQLKSSMGLDGSVIQIVKYSDLKNSTNPLLKAAYSEELIGEDPLIVVHSSNVDNGINLSIIDVSPYSLFEAFETQGDRNIFSELGMSDQEYMNTQGKNEARKETLMMSDNDFRTLGITILASHMVKALGDKVSFSNLGVVSVNTKTTYSRMIHDINATKQNLHILSKIPAIANGAISDAIRSVIESDEVMDKEIKTDHLSVVKSYLSDVVSGNVKDDYLKPYAKKLLEELGTNDEMSILRTIEAMKEFLIGYHDPDKVINLDIYMMLVRTSREISTGKFTNINDLHDISSLGKALTTAYHQKNDYVQDVIEITNEASYIISKKVTSDMKAVGGTTDKPGLARKVMKRFFKNNTNISLKKYIGDTGSQVYQHLYKKKIVKLVDSKNNFIKDENGNIITKEVIVPELHISLNDPETKKAYDNGIIDDLDLEFTQEIMSTLKTRWIEYIKHKANKERFSMHSTNRKVMSDKEAEAEYNALFSEKGVIPLIDNSVSELLFKGNIKKGVKKGIKQVEHSEALFEDSIDTTKEWSTVYSGMSDHITSQMKEDSRLTAAGLKYIEIDGEVVLVSNNPAKNEVVSTDVWKSFTYVSHSLVRNIEYESKVLPAARNAVSLLEQFGPRKQKNNINFIEEYINKAAFRKNADEKLEIDLPDGGKLKVGALTRGFKGIYNAAVLPFKLSIGAASMMFNINALIKHSLSATISNDSSMPKIASFIKAAEITLNSKKFKKVKELSLKMQIWGREESDITSSPWLNVTDHFAFNQMFTNILNWSTDTWARTLVMTASMIEDGSYDAFSYDKESGDIGYDETKDLRFYNEDGSRKDDKKSKSLYEAIKDDVMKTEGLTERPEKLPFGYGATDAIAMKQIAETKVLGAFSQTNAALVSNNWLGNLLSHFRTFAPTRLFNAGILAEERLTTVGQRIVATEDKNGNVISKKEVKRIKGELQTLTSAIGEIRKLKAYTPSEFADWYNNSNSEDKNNLMRTLMTVMQFVIVAGIMGAIFDDDDEEDKYNKLSYYYWFDRYLQDITIMTTVVDVLNDPFPAVAMTNRIIEKGSYYKTLPYSGSVDEIVKTIGKLSEEEEV